MTPRKKPNVTKRGVLAWAVIDGDNEIVLESIRSSEKHVREIYMVLKNDYRIVPVRITEIAKGRK